MHMRLYCEDPTPVHSGGRRLDDGRLSGMRPPLPLCIREGGRGRLLRPNACASARRRAAAPVPLDVLHGPAHGVQHEIVEGVARVGPLRSAASSIKSWT